MLVFSLLSHFTNLFRAAFEVCDNGRGVSSGSTTNILRENAFLNVRILEFLYQSMNIDLSSKYLFNAINQR